MSRVREAEALDAYSTAVSFAAERVGPAVVKIETQVARGKSQQQGQGQGSGVLFRRDGQILTNAHVVEGARTIRIVLGDGRRFEAGLLGADRAHDIAALRIGARDLPVAELSERPLRVGQLVVAVGNPYGLGWTVTSGVVSALERTLPAPQGGKLEHLIQTDAPINPGSSGGPLVDAQGRIVGITTAIVPFAQGLGFAVPTYTALSVLGRFIPASEDKNDQTASLGLGGMRAHIDEWIVTRNHLKQKDGILILEIKPESPSEKASLKLLDIIVDVDGHPVRSPADLAKQLKTQAPGKNVSIGFLREGTLRKVTVTPE